LLLLLFYCCSLLFVFLIQRATIHWSQIITYVVVNEHMSSSSAQKYCRENFIDLATVRNEIQNQQLQSLDSNWAWIGLFRDPNFYWSDGSSFSFSHFDDVDNQNGSERVMCGVSSPHRAGRWRFLDCNIRIPFVCYSIPGEC
uniref:C-type lectin domain-containing protein n=1 Tax=Stegastes partitus TaxID=144197 RepID=A0A3B4Z703_9TELE